MNPETDYIGLCIEHLCYGVGVELCFECKRLLMHERYLHEGWDRVILWGTTLQRAIFLCLETVAIAATRRLCERPPSGIKVRQSLSPV